MFQFDLRRHAAGGGELLLGGVDPTKFQGPLTYVPLTHKSYWAFDMGGVSLDGLDYCGPQCSGIADTGTSLLAGPAAAVAALNRAIGAVVIPGGEALLLNCSDAALAALPPVTVRLNGKVGVCSWCWASGGSPAWDPIIPHGKTVGMGTGLPQLCIPTPPPLHPPRPPGPDTLTWWRPWLAASAERAEQLHARGRTPKLIWKTNNL